MKRRFRSQQGSGSQARYPVYSEGRRTFLRQLGTVLAGGAVTSLLGCGPERVVGADRTPDSGFPTGGAVDAPPAPLDLGGDTSGVGPDVTPAPLDGGWPGDVSGGVPDMPLAPPDQGTWTSDGMPPPPDMQMVLDDGDPD